MTPAATPPVAEVPMIHTTLGNVPLAALQHQTRWERSGDEIKFTEVYKTAGGMVVRENAYTYLLTATAEVVAPVPLPTLAPTPEPTL